MDDFDFDFDFEGNPVYEFGAEDFSNLFGDIDELMNLSSLDLSGFDFGSVDDIYGGSNLGAGYSGFDFGTSDDVYQGSDFGEEGAGTIVITGERPTDLSGFDFETADEVYQGSIGTDLSGFDQATADEVYQGSNLGTDPYEIDGLQGSRDEDDALTPTKPTDDTNKPCPPGSEKVQKFADGSTLTLDCKGRVIGSTPATINPDDPEDCPAGSEKRIPQPDGRVMVLDCKDRFIRMEGGKVVEPPDDKKPTDDWTKWIALLGGLMGLLGQNKGTAPAGYKFGNLPKYTATRGQAMSPTAGGRRPGGAGIPSLTGGVTYTPIGAAQGGLMGLAAGGKARPARYLAGGTDGMADKIQTSIDGKQPARLSHGEFVIPADVVSHLGNGNSDAGADVLYEMMAKVRKARTGNPKQGKQINPRKYTPV